MKPEKMFVKKFTGYAVSACASLALIFFCIYAGLGVNQNAVYMTLDINPSIQIKMDESFQVKQLIGLNQDGKDVVSELSWKKREPIQRLLDGLIQKIAEKAYLTEDGSILVTLSASREEVCDELENVFTQQVDAKLNELEISGIMIAYQKSDDRSAGRGQLEEELVRMCGLSEDTVSKMTVTELIRYCQEHTSLNLKTSKVSASKHTESFEQDKQKDISLQDRKSTRLNSSHIH